METQVVYHCVCFNVNIELWHLVKVLWISKGDKNYHLNTWLNILNKIDLSIHYTHIYLLLSYLFSDFMLAWSSFNTPLLAKHGKIIVLFQNS